MKNAKLFQNEQDFPDFDGDGAVRRLSKAITFETVGYVDTSRIRYGEFTALHGLWQERNRYAGIK